MSGQSDTDPFTSENHQVTLDLPSSKHSGYLKISFFITALIQAHSLLLSHLNTCNVLYDGVHSRFLLENKPSTLFFQNTVGFPLIGGEGFRLH